MNRSAGQFEPFPSLESSPVSWRIRRTTRPERTDGVERFWRAGVQETRAYYSPTHYPLADVLAEGAWAVSVSSLVVMSDPNWRPDAGSLEAIAACSPEWPYGRVRVAGVTRIGADFGLSGGAVFRVRIASDTSGSLSVVVKRESAQSVEQALRFHRVVGPRVPGAVPVCLGGVVDKERDVGLLALEDVAPAEQGDVLSGCETVQAQAAVRALARVHAASWADAEKQASRDVERWQARSLEHEAWGERLSGATARFPSILNDSVARRLLDLPRRVEVAITSLRHGPACWIHCDAHLDNVLFRGDGTAVLLDWSGAVFGPPALDLARLLTEGIDAGASEAKARLLVAGYSARLAASGATGAIDDAWARLSDGVAVLVQSAVGWASRDEGREPRERMRALQENLLRSVCAWATNPEMTARGRVFGPSAQA